MIGRFGRWLRIHSVEVTLFGLALGTRVGYWTYKGTIVPNDWSKYFETCEIWWTDPLGILWAHKGPLYAGFTLPVCSVLSLPGATETWWIVTQLFLSALTTIVVYRVGILAAGRVTGGFAGLGLVILWDTFQWSVMLGSDALFTFAVALALWTFARYADQQTLGRRLILVVVMGFLAVIRPFGFPIVVAWLVVDIVTVTRSDRLSVVPTRVIPVSLVVGAIGAFPLIAKRRSLVNVWSEGVIVGWTYFYEYPVTESNSLVGFIVGNLPHIAVLAVLRVGAFFLPFIPRHSTPHILVNIMTYTPITALGLLGAYDVVRNRFELARQWVVPIVAVLGVTAITFVSYGFRYRAPLGPSITLLATYAVVTRIDTTRIENFLKRITGV